MTDDTQPEALRLANVCSNLTRYSMDAHLIAAELRRQHTRIAELESELEAVGAGGVQALSAAPANHNASRALQGLDFIMRVYEPCMGKPAPDEEMATIVEATKRLLLGWWGEHRDTVRAMLAASPTSPAEQQAPSAAAAGTVVLEAALRAIHQAIELIGEPADERMRTVRRVLRGAVIVAEDAGEAATAPQQVGDVPESLVLAVDQWFADNIKDSGGCTSQDVHELAALFYDVTHEGGRESVDDALAIVESFGPGIGGINDAYARQVLLAEEVKRLREQAPNPERTGELLMGLAVIRELTGTQQKGLEETIEAVRAAVNAQKHPPAPATMSPANRLVAYSAATRLRELGFEWDATAEAWLQPSPKAVPVEQDDHQILAITTAYEQGVGKGHQAYNSGKEIANPYSPAYRCDLAWQYGYGEGKEQAQREAKAAPQQAPAPLSEREAFEAWIEKDGGDLGTFGTPPNMHYRNSAVNNAWVAWQARAALAAQGGKDA